MKAKKPVKRAAKPKASPRVVAAQINAYLAKAAPDQRVALQKLRVQIQQACPEAIEVYGYGIGGFKYMGRPLLYFGYAKAHCAVYGGVAREFEKELKGFITFKGTIRFTPKKLIPAGMVKKIVKARMTDIESNAR